MTEVDFGADRLEGSARALLARLPSFLTSASPGMIAKPKIKSQLTFIILAGGWRNYAKLVNLPF